MSGNCNFVLTAKKLFLLNESLLRSSFNAVCKEFVEVDAGHIHGDTYCWLSRVHLFIQCVFPGYDRGILETQWLPSGPTGSNVRLFWRVFRDPTENWGAESFWRRGRGRDESIICGSRRCIATVTLHMYTSPERNTVWTQNIAIYPMCIEELSRFTSASNFWKKLHKHTFCREVE